MNTYSYIAQFTGPGVKSQVPVVSLPPGEGLSNQRRPARGQNSTDFPQSVTVIHSFQPVIHRYGELPTFAQGRLSTFFPHPPAFYSQKFAVYPPVLVSIPQVSGCLKAFIHRIFHRIPSLIHNKCEVIRIFSWIYPQFFACLSPADAFSSTETGLFSRVVHRFSTEIWPVIPKLTGVVPPSGLVFRSISKGYPQEKDGYPQFLGGYPQLNGYWGGNSGRAHNMPLWQARFLWYTTFKHTK